MSNNGHNVLPTSPREVWPFMRDNAKPLTQLDAYYLSQCRAYTPPSKAHVKRLLKLRPKVSRPPQKIQIDQQPKVYHNAAAKLGREAQAMNQRAVLVERCCQDKVQIRPEPVLTRLPSHLVAQSRVTNDGDPWDMAAIERNIQRLANEHQQALATVGR